MRQPVNLTLFAYWDELRGSRPAPFRTDIQPGRIATILDRVFVLELEAKGGVVFRLAGSTLCGQFGGELRGRNFLEHWPGRDKELLAGVLTEVTQSAEVAVLEFEGVCRTGGRVTFEMLILPLTRAIGIDRFIGSACTTSDIDWAANGPIGACHLLRRTLFVPRNQSATGGAPAVAPVVAPPTPLVTAPRPFVQRPTASRPPVQLASKARPHFRVVDGGLSDRPKTENR